MIIEKIKQLFQKQSLAKNICLIILVMLIIFYFKTFFTKGVYFNDTFLRKEKVSSFENYYNGKSKQGNINIIVIRSKDNNKNSEVIYNLPNNNKYHYIVSVDNKSDSREWIGSIKDERENLLFEGGHMKDSPILYDINKGTIYEIDSAFNLDAGIKYDSEYKVPFKNIIDFTYFSNDTIRGNFGLLIMALLLLFVTIIDIKYPLLFFKLSHFVEVKDPEPSDFYIMMQHFNWVLLPIISFVMLICAIYVQM